jgi:hypothetical protein
MYSVPFIPNFDSQAILELKMLGILLQKELFPIQFPKGARGSVVVKALCYKPEGRRFDTQ